MALINPDDIFTMSAIILAGTAFAFWAENQRWGRHISGPVWAILFGAVLSNVGIISHKATIFDMINQILVPVAIPLLLFKANLRRIINESGEVLVAFIIGSIGTVIGVLIAFHLMPLGQEANKLAGVFAATYIGGSMNFVAVAQSLFFNESSIYGAAVATDNLMSVLYLLFLVAMPSLSIVRKIFPSKIIEKAQAINCDNSKIIEDDKLNILHISFVLALSLFICVLARLLAKMLGVEKYAILFITLFAVIIANLFPKRMAIIEGDFAFGAFFMYLFFVTIGAAADLVALAVDTVRLIPFVAIILLVHSVILLIGTKIFKIDLAESLIASNACILGPAPAAAVAVGQGWKALITPGILCGILGYVIANFIGVALAELL